MAFDDVVAPSLSASVRYGTRKSGSCPPAILWLQQKVNSSGIIAARRATAVLLKLLLARPNCLLISIVSAGYGNPNPECALETK